MTSPIAHSVHDQRELDDVLAAIVTPADHLLVIDPTDDRRIELANYAGQAHVMSGTVDVIGCPLVYVRGHAEVYATGTSVVVARQDSTVHAIGHALVTAFDHTTVRAGGAATVSALDHARVIAHGQSAVDLDGNAHCMAYARARVFAKGWSTAVLHEFSQARGMGLATLHIYGATHEIVVSGEASAFLYDIEPAELMGLTFTDSRNIYPVDQMVQIGAARASR